MQRIHLRDLFWLLLVVGLVLGWSVDHFRVRARIYELETNVGFKDFSTALNGMEQFLKKRVIPLTGKEKLLT
jgi:hypothetical protein